MIINNKHIKMSNQSFASLFLGGGRGVWYKNRFIPLQNLLFGCITFLKISLSEFENFNVVTKKIRKFHFENFMFHQ